MRMKKRAASVGILRQYYNTQIKKSRDDDDEENSSHRAHEIFPRYK
jgi:hypothetical protein